MSKPNRWMKFKDLNRVIIVEETADRDVPGGTSVIAVALDLKSADLIAAAPEMLDALKEAKRYAIESGVSYPSQVDAAIAKAEGRS